MEETVIWEQHTVTLHRVSVLNGFLLFPSLLLCLFGKLLFLYSLPVHHLPERLSRTERASCAAAAGCAAVKQ